MNILRNFKLWRLSKKEEGLPKYMVRGIATARAFSLYNYKRGKNKGLLILFGDKNKIGKMVARSEGDLKEFILRKYKNPLLYSRNVFELYDEMASRDGAIIFDFKGNLLDTEVYIEKPSLREVKPLIRNIKEIKGRIGARHIASAYACIKGFSVISVSEEKGTVIPFYKGKILHELVFNPEKENVALKI